MYTQTLTHVHVCSGLCVCVCVCKCPFANRKNVSDSFPPPLPAARKEKLQRHAGAGYEGFQDTLSSKDEELAELKVI